MFQYFDKLNFRKDLDRSKKLAASNNNATLLNGRMPQRGLHDAVSIGCNVLSPLEITATESMMNMWLGAFMDISPLTRSRQFVTSKLALSAQPLPFTLLNTLTMALSVNVFSATARVHLGAFDAKQLSPVLCGDTIKAAYCVDSAVHSKDYTIVTSSHRLYNQHEQTVFKLIKKTMFSPLEIISSSSSFSEPSDEEDANCEEIWRKLVFSIPVDDDKRANSLSTQQTLTAADDLIIHTDFKNFGISENYMLMKLLCITNDHHHNTVIFFVIRFIQNN